MRVAELITDSFAGGGGASTGIFMALGRHPDIAINHDAVALAMHAANHPETHHIATNIWKVGPREATGGRPVGLAWFSPDCKHFSKAKGGKPVEKGIRDLAWVVVNWAKLVRPRVILLENVEEFQTWGPLGPDNRPCPERKGETVKRWLRELKKLGYNVEWCELVAADYGAPTIRKRLFIIARCDGEPIVWPETTHFNPKKKPKAAAQKTLEEYVAAQLAAGKKFWRTAAEIIDFTLPCPSIFLTKDEGRAIGVKRPLAPATMDRIGKGVDRYVLRAAKPFIVNLTHHGGDRNESVDAPFNTITGAHRGEKAIVVPSLLTNTTGHGPGDPEAPVATVTTGGHQAVVAPTLIQSGYGEREGQEPRALDIAKPLGTVVAQGVKHAVVSPHLMTHRNAEKPHSGPDEPTHTVTAGGAHINVVAPVLVRTAHGEQDKNGKKRGQGAHSTEEPLGTVTASQDFAVAGASIVGCGGRAGQSAPRGMEEPMGTGTAKADACLVAPLVTKFRKGNDGESVEEPFPTITANSFIKREGGNPPLGVVSAFIAKHYGGPNGEQTPGSDAREPIATVTAQDHNAVVSAGLQSLRGSDRRMSAPDAPVPTVTAQGFHEAEVRAFLLKYYGNEKDGCDITDPSGTVTTKERFGLVYVHGEPYTIVDIGMRMLTPRELFRAQGFPETYIIDRGTIIQAFKTKRGVWEVGDERPMSKSEQVRMCGNSVCPPLAEALVRANYTPREVEWEPKADAPSDFRLEAAE